MNRTAIVLSKVFILVLVLAGLLLQTVLLPIEASQSAQEFSEVAFLHLPILVLSILVVICGQVVLGCIWVLLSLVRRDTIFSERAFRFVDIMIGALAVACALIVAALLILGLTAQVSPPGIVVPASGAALSSAALALVLVVMRGLLVKATEQERYLAEVV